MNTQTIKSRPDFSELCERYAKLSNGPRAELRRLARRELVPDVPAYYRWLGNERPAWGLENLVFCLPFVSLRPGAESLGRVLRRAGASEVRVFQILRSEFPNDLGYLRRLLQQHQPVVDPLAFGELFWFWGQSAKRRLVTDYFSTATDN